jgi:hypothetical protein
MLFLGTGSEKFKMAAAKTGSTCISASIQDSKEIPTTIRMFLGSANSMKISRRLHLETGSEKFKIAAPNQKYLFLLLYKIAKKFQRITHVIRGEELNGDIGYALS